MVFIFRGQGIRDSFFVVCGEAQRRYPAATMFACTAASVSSAV